MSRPASFKVLIAGGGVAALEAMLALRQLVGDHAQLELLAPDDELTLKPLAVGEAFGLAEPPRLSLESVTRDLDATRHQDALDSVDLEASTVKTASGEVLGYDALLLAIGAQAGEALPGAITYRGGPDNERVVALLAEIDAGSVESVVFAVPPTAQWALPIYELALLTAARAGEDRTAGPGLSLVTHEEQSLTLFGPRASDSVAELLRDAGIELIAQARAIGVTGAGLSLADGRVIIGDRVVASPRLSVPPIEGLPQGSGGFFDTDSQMRLKGATAVYAAGDSTWFPIKQGGIAAQQADVAASSIASLIDPDVEAVPFRPTLRGALFTGGAPRYLRADVGRRAMTSAAASAPLWWPPSKIAGRHLAAYLAERHDFTDPLKDLEALEDEDSESAERDHTDALELALTSADADAHSKDYAGALRWLDVAESINLALPVEYAEKRRLWSAAADRPDGQHQAGP